MGVVVIGGYKVSFTWLLVGRVIYNIGMVINKLIFNIDLDIYSF